MNRQTAVQPVAVEYNHSAATPENPVSEEDCILNVASQSETAESSKTMNLLKEWKVVSSILQTGQDAYSAVKGSSKIAEASLDATEKAMTTLKGYSANVIEKVKPVLRVVDNTASEGLERLQKRFPTVKESPEKIYAGVVERLGNIVAPAVNKAVAITDTGRQQVKKAARKIIETTR